MTASVTAPVETPVTTTCPLSGREVGIERVPDPELGAASLDEMEILVRNEWRRCLGPHTYLRDHSPAIVRAVLVYGLAPESPVRETIVRQLVLWELATLGGWGLGRVAVRHEFAMLCRAVRAMLARMGVPADATERMASAVDRRLADVLAWDEPASGAKVAHENWRECVVCPVAPGRPPSSSGDRRRAPAVNMPPRAQLDGHLRVAWRLHGSLVRRAGRLIGSSPPATHHTRPDS